MYGNLYIILIVFFASCQNKSSQVESIINSLSGDEDSQSFFKMNERLIFSIIKYESKISFTDTLIWGHNIRINSEQVIENYYNSLDLASLALENNVVDSLYRSNHSFLLDSLFAPRLSELHNQQEEFEEIQKIANLTVTGKSNKYFRGNQLVKNQIFYNHIFQFLFRYKLEEEMATDYNYPVIQKDSLLSNGQRELSIYLVNSLEADDFTSAIEVDKQFYDFQQMKELMDTNGEIKIQYNPNSVNDSIIIKSFTMFNFSEERKEARMKYKTIKN